MTIHVEVYEINRWSWIEHACKRGLNSKTKVDETVIFRWITHKCGGRLNNLMEMD